MAPPIIRLALCFLVVFGVPRAHAQDRPTGGSLSLTEAVEYARTNSPGYITERNQLGSARWNLRSAYGDLLPALNVSNSFGYTAEGERRLDDVRLSTQPATFTSRYSLGMSLQVSGASLLAPAVARAEERSIQEQVDGAESLLVRDVSQRYLAALEAREQAVQAERELERTEAHVQLAQARFEIGAGTQLDVRRAEVQRGQAEVRLLQSRNTAANEVLLLGQTIGVPLDADITLTQEFTLFPPAWNQGELIERALDQNATLRAAEAQSDAANTRLRSARTSYLPTLSLNAGFSGFVSELGLPTGDLVAQELAAQQNRFAGCVETNQIRAVAGLQPLPCGAPADEGAIRAQLAGRNQFPFDYVSQPFSASLTVSLPLFNGLNRERQVEEARIARSNAQQQVRAEEMRVRVEVETAVRNLETAYQAALLQQQVRQTAEEELLLAEERFRFGATTSVEVVDAQASLAEAERAEISAVYEYHRALTSLEAVLGGTLVD